MCDFYCDSGCMMDVSGIFNESKEYNSSRPIQLLKDILEIPSSMSI